MSKVGPGHGLSKSLTSVTTHSIRIPLGKDSPKTQTPPIYPRNYPSRLPDRLYTCPPKSQNNCAQQQSNLSSSLGSTNVGLSIAAANASNSNGFIRLKFNDGQTICGMACSLLECVVNVKERENGVNVISRAAQVRQFGEFVDTHVVRGRCLEIFVRNKSTGAIVGGAVNITQETLASKCLSAPKKKKEFPLLLDKGGELLVTVKYFSEKEEQSSVARRLRFTEKEKDPLLSLSSSQSTNVNATLGTMRPKSNSQDLLDMNLVSSLFASPRFGSPIMSTSPLGGGVPGEFQSSSDKLFNSETHLVVDPPPPSSPTETMRNRRGAYKEKKVHVVNGHQFVSHFFTNFTFCSFCSEFLWGLLTNQGYRCLQCTLVVHKKCHLRVLTQCPGSLQATPAAQALVERFQINVPHKFSSVSYHRPSFCEHCGQLIFPFCHSSFKCKACGFICHKKCQSFVANICGVDQKSIAEALACINFDNEDTLERAFQTEDSSEIHPNYVGLYSTIPAVTATSNQLPGTTPYEALHQYSALLPADVTPDSSAFGSENSSYVSMDANVMRDLSRRRTSRDSLYEQMWMSTSGQPVFVNNNITNCDLNSFHFRTLIGRGSFGKVVLAEHVGSGEAVAIKILKKHHVLMDDDRDAVFLERDVLHLTAYHPFFTHLFATFQNTTHLFFVMEYVRGGDMMFHMAQNRKLPEAVAKFLAAEIILALKFLHDNNVIYRDLKLDNVLIDSEGHVRLTDFGMCRKLKHSEDYATTLCGTPDYMAPEIIANRSPRYTTSVDWWALGVLLYEMVCGSTPFRAPRNDEKTRHDMIIHGRVSHYPHHLSTFCKSVIKSFLTVNVLDRLGCKADARTHVFFNGINFDQLEKKMITPPHNFHLQGNKSDDFDTSNFEDQFTREKVCVTPVEESQVPDADHQRLFKNFSFLSS